MNSLRASVSHRYSGFHKMASIWAKDGWSCSTVFSVKRGIETSSSLLLSVGNPLNYVERHVDKGVAEMEV